MFTNVVINKFLDHIVPPTTQELCPSMKDLLFELTGGLENAWPRISQLPSLDLSAKYAILFGIGIANWCPSSHHSGWSISLATLLFQMGRSSPFNYGAFVIGQLRRHIISQASDYLFLIPI